MGVLAVYVWAQYQLRDRTGVYKSAVPTVVDVQGGCQHALYLL